MEQRVRERGYSLRFIRTSVHCAVDFLIYSMRRIHFIHIFVGLKVKYPTRRRARNAFISLLHCLRSAHTGSHDNDVRTVHTFRQVIRCKKCVRLHIVFRIVSHPFPSTHWHWPPIPVSIDGLSWISESMRGFLGFVMPCHVPYQPFSFPSSSPSFFIMQIRVSVTWLYETHTHTHKHVAHYMW